MPKFQSGAEESESASVTRHTVTATTVIRDIMVLTRAMATAITGVIHIPERIMAAGRTNTAIVSTSITSVITTATRMQGKCEVTTLAWSNSRPAFLLPEGSRLVAAAFPKEILQDCSALFLQNTGRNFTAVIQSGDLKKVHDASGCSSRGIRAAENYAPDPRVQKRTCAHRARLFSHIKIAISQTPITNGRFCLC